MDLLRLPTHIWLYGLVGGLLIAGLKYAEYRWLVVQHSIEIYGGIVAVIFAAVGVWLGRRLTVPSTPEVGVREVHVEVPVPSPVPALASPHFERDDAKIGELGITPRELETLALIADGLSNREIAERLFVSEHTVKTHSSRVFDKLEAKRRTQAVQRARELRLIP